MSSEAELEARGRTSRDLLKNPKTKQGYHEQDSCKATGSRDMQCKIPGNILKPDPAINTLHNLEEAVPNLQPLLTMDQI